VKKSELRRIIREEIRSLKEEIRMSSDEFLNEDEELWDFIEGVHAQYLDDESEEGGEATITKSEFEYDEMDLESFNKFIKWLKGKGGSVIITGDEGMDLHLKSVGRDSFKISW
jgi:hypothetical protein